MDKEAALEGSILRLQLFGIVRGSRNSEQCSDYLSNLKRFILYLILVDMVIDGFFCCVKMRIGGGQGLCLQQSHKQ